MFNDFNYIYIYSNSYTLSELKRLSIFQAKQIYTNIRNADFKASFKIYETKGLLAFVSISSYLYTLANNLYCYQVTKIPYLL